MPVVKMGSGAQTQAKHCRGRGEGDRCGCQVQFTFWFCQWSGERESDLVLTPTCCFSLLSSAFCCAIQMVLWTQRRLRTGGNRRTKCGQLGLLCRYMQMKPPNDSMCFKCAVIRKRSVYLILLCSSYNQYFYPFV